MSDAERFDRDDQLKAGLKRLAADTVVPPVDAAQEQRLLAAFDEYWSARRRRTFARPLAAAGLLAAAASVAWMVAARGHRADAARPTPPTTASTQTGVRPGVRPVSDPRQTGQTAVAKAPGGRRPRPARPPAGDTTFVMWPGARDLPRFESGQLMRVELPAPVAASLGLRPQQPSAFVQTDVLVGQDGYARAVRLVQ